MNPSTPSLLAAAFALLLTLGCASSGPSQADLGRTYDGMRRERAGFNGACDWDRPESTREPPNSNQNSLGNAALDIAVKEGIYSLF